MIVLAVTWVAKENREQEVADIFRKLEADSRREPGCLMYVAHRHKDDPSRFFIYEQYRDDTALQAHRDSAHFQEYAVKALRDIADRIQGDLYLPLTAT
jgi:quinol monooxygenase YgiN